MNKKIVLILISVVFFLLLCCGALFWGGTLLFGELEEQAKNITDSVVVDICEVTDGNTADLRSYFSDDYAQGKTDAELQQTADSIIGESGDCSQFEVGSIWDFLSSGNNLEITSTNGVNTAEYSFTNADGDRITLNLTQERDRWVIDQVMVSQ
jgi:hypothetical protein